ncbi:MAG: WD40/YVTN/BNR-like repeat-containing protein, partial [bacterium]
MALIPPFLAILSGCVDSQTSGAADVIFADVHGLAVDPNDRSILYVATHHGLFRGVNDAAWSKVGAQTLDLMGFTMHPTQPSVMYASGHPGGMSRDDWAIGVVKSTDGGKTWQTMALKNEVDFHAMTISLASPETVWGHYYRNQRVYESVDGGLTWMDFAPQAPPPQIAAIASHAMEEETVFAGTSDGVWVSRDAGHEWVKLPGSQPGGPAGALATSKANEDLVWAFFPS